MIPKRYFKPVSTLMICVLWFTCVCAQTDVITTKKQYCSKSKANKETKVETYAAAVPSRKKVTIHLPDNYVPPIAKDNEVIFPETYAGKKRQKLLRKKRKKSKNKACIATAF